MNAGDVLITGTPEGRVDVVPGDVVGLGRLVNSIVREPENGTRGTQIVAGSKGPFSILRSQEKRCDLRLHHCQRGFCRLRDRNPDHRGYQRCGTPT